MATQYKISVAQLAALNKIATTTSFKLDAIEAEAKGLFEAASHSSAAPLQAKIDDLNARRYRSVIAGVTAARKALSPASWTNLHAFINNEYRNTTQMVKQ